MYQGAHVKHGKKSKKTSRIRLNKASMLFLAIVVLVNAAIGTTVAWLTADTTSVENTFTPSSVACEVDETFDGNVKSNVKIMNTGNTDAYIRATVIVTWKDAQGNVYGGATPQVGTDYSITFESGTGWALNTTDGYWYYTRPVSPGYSTGILITECKPVDGKTPEGYGLSVEILAEAIQALGTDGNGNTPTQLAWGVTISEGSVTAYNG